MMNYEAKLEKLNIQLPQAPKKGGLYTPAQCFGNHFVYVSGCGPVVDGETITGILGREFNVEQGQKFAEQCILNVLATLKAEIGSLNRIKTCVKITAFVASANDFYNQPQVANGASKILGDVFGEKNLPSRSAIGVHVLPGNIPVEIEALFEIED